MKRVSDVSRLVGVIVALGVLATACGGAPEVYETPPGGSAATSELTLPAPIPATPAFAVHARKPLSASQLKALGKTTGVAALAAVERRTMKVSGPKRSLRLKVAAVQPLEFRSVAPAATRDAEFVWLSLMDGNAVTTFAAAKKLGISGGGSLGLSGDQEIPVGGFADNGTPNIADVLVQAPATVARPTLVVIGASSGTTIESLAADLKRAVPDARLQKLIPSGKVTVTTTAPQGFVAAPGGLQPPMAQAVSQLLAAAEGKVWVNSGYRSYAHQAALWQGALEKYGDPEVADNWVAPPGHSMHELGLAVDLGGDVELAARLVAELGIPLFRPMHWEPWHFELSGSRS